VQINIVNSNLHSPIALVAGHLSHSQTGSDQSGLKKNKIFKNHIASTAEFFAMFSNQFCHIADLKFFHDAQ